MADPHAHSPVVPALILPSNGLAAVTCPAYHNFHLHAASRGLVKGPCGGSYRLWVRGTADESTARRIRGALEAKRRNELKEAPSATER